MVTISIKISPDEEMEVDKMEEGDDGSMCPLATQDEELNAKNKQECIDEPTTGKVTPLPTAAIVVLIIKRTK